MSEAVIARRFMEYVSGVSGKAGPRPLVTTFAAASAQQTGGQKLPPPGVDLSINDSYPVGSIFG